MGPAAGLLIAPVSGALAGAASLRLIFGEAGGLGTTVPQRPTVQMLASEVLLTCLLVTVILGVGSRLGALGPHAALPVGGLLVACGMLGGPVSGPSMNPARSLGPAIVSGRFADIWIFLAGPLAGAAIGVGLAWVVHGPQSEEERKAARGEGSS